LHENLRKIYAPITEDIAHYMVYIELVPLGFGGSCYKITSLPYSKSIGEHPYWLVVKMQYLLRIFNNVNNKHRNK